MFYRRKLLLGLLQAFENNLEKMRLQKLLFLLSRFQKGNGCYQFIPYKYGCYSFQSAADLKTLAKYNMVQETDNSVSKTTDTDYLLQLKISDRQAIKSLKALYGGKTSTELTRSTYISHPYYAINSLIAKDVLNADQYERVLQARPKKNETILFTIGYEGLSLEEYLNKLIVNDIRLLCDVRNNPLSMKFGFSKNMLRSACESVGIAYEHIPEVGIQSEDRQELNSQTDYDLLFESYKMNLLPNTFDNQKNILNLLLKYKRIALTCFEANICQCHRGPLAEAITKLDGWQYQVRHL